jgi:DNA repair protein RecO (recombination protein O)
MDGRQALAGLNAFCAVAAAAIPEREPHAAVFEAAEMLLDAMTATDAPHWLPLYVRWEAGLLEALGFGLDLSACAVTGTADDLLYVSPRSGRAVSAAAGADYAARLFRLPQFLLASQNAVVDPGEIVAGLSLTAHFLLERVLQPHGRHMPPARLHLGAIAARESD